jgi:solute carrier family 25 carnitine/acylcarnitine transporter 20/29
MAPMERIKCLLQVQGHTAAAPKYSGMTDCAIQIYRSGGIASLYKGTMLTLMRDIPGSIAWFGTYEVIKRELVKLQGIEDPSKLSPILIMVAGGFAGMACWYVSEKEHLDELEPRFNCFNGLSFVCCNNKGVFAFLLIH